MPKIVYNPLTSDFDYISKSTDFKGNFKPSSGIWAYASAQYFSGGRFYHQGAPATDYELANKKYVDDAVIAGGGYTDEQAQDAVGTILGVGFVYDDAGNAITLESYIASSSAISRFADSSNIRTRFPGSSNLNRTLVNTISSNLDIRIDSLFNWSSNKGVYYPSGIGAGLSGSYSAHRQDTTIHFTKSSLDGDYQGSSQAIAKFADSSNIRFRFIGSSQGIARFAGSSQINRSLLNSISSNLDSRIDNLFSWSSAALTLYGASSHTHGVFYGWSGATGFYSVSSNYLGHSSNRDIHYPSSQLLGWLNALYQESGTSSTSDVTWSGAYQFTAVSSLSKTRLDSIFNYSSAAIRLFAGSSNINRTLLNTISSNLDTKIDSLFNFSANKSLYPASSLVNRNLINTISSNIDTRIDSLFSWSSNSKNLYADSSNIRFRFQASSLARQSYLHSANQSIHSFNIANYITSTNAIARFADSSSIISKYTASGKIAGLALSIMSPADGEVLKWDSANGYWSSQADSTGVGSFDQTQYITSTNSIARFADSANINAKILPANYTNGWAYVSSQSIVVHGYGTRPTMVGLTPSGNDTFGYSLTYDATNITFYLSVAGKHWVNWFAGGFLPSSSLKAWFDQLYTPAVFKSGWARVSSESVINHQLGEIPDSISVTASGENAIGISVKNIDENSMRVFITDDDFHTISWNAGGTSPQVCGYNTQGELTGVLNGVYTASSQINKTYIDTISSNLDLRLDAMGSFDPHNYIISTTAISRFTASNQVNRPLINSISSNLDTRIDSIFNFSANKTLYYPSSVGHYHTGSGSKYHSAYLSGQRVLDLFNHLLYGTSSNLIARFAQSSVVNTNLITTISGNLDERIDALYNWSSNKSWYYPSSVGHFFTNSGSKLYSSYLSANKVLDRFDHTLYGISSSLIARFAASTTVNNALITSISSNLDGRIDSLFNYSSNGKNLYADSSNVRYRFVASSVSLSRYNNYVGHSGNTSKHVSVGFSSNSKWAYGWLNVSGSQLSSLLRSGNEYTQSYKSSQASKIHSYHAIISSQYIKDYVASSSLKGRYYPSSTGKATSGSVAKLWLWSSNKSLYANSANVRLRFPASSTSISRFADSSNIRYRFQASSLSYQSYKHSSNNDIHIKKATSIQSGQVATWGDFGGNIHGWYNYLPPMTFSIANVRVSAQQVLNLGRFKVPTNSDGSSKKLHIFRSYACNSSQASIHGLYVQVLSGNSIRYKHSSSTLKEGYPISSTDGGNTTIRFGYSANTALTGIHYGSCLIQVNVI